MQLVQSLIDVGVLKTPAIVSAFSNINRADFVLPEFKAQAYLDEPLPIGYGQTISQPWTVAFMLELLEPKLGHKILDVGSGSGWQTALLAHIVSRDEAGQTVNNTGRVYGLEFIPELVRQSRVNISHYSFLKKKIVTIHCLNAKRGLPQEAPFDRIISAATLGDEIPVDWQKQLKIGGRLVTPIGSEICLLIKQGDNEFVRQYHKGFSFVPFVGS
jgi:protein-L-isoaspartate(D-aspartate) O-methyltransferase